MAFQQQNFKPDKDAGWGLIFRLNALWERVDRRAESGDYGGWEVVLDRIFSNLMYRNEASVITEGEGDAEKVKDVQINDIEFKEFLKVKQKIQSVKLEMMRARRNKDFPKMQVSKLKLYQILMFYDIWLRKFMQERDLYLKETEHNPSKALFGR